MASADIFRQYLQPVKSFTEYSGELQALDNARLQGENMRQENTLRAAAMRERQSALSDRESQRNALQRVYSGLPANTDPIARARALQADPMTAEYGVAAEKSVLENQKTMSETDKIKAESEIKKYEYLAKAAEHHSQALAYLSEPQHIVGWIDAGIAKGIFQPQMRDQMIAKAQSSGSVDAFKQMASQAAIPALEKFKQMEETARAKLQSDTSISNNNNTVGATLRGQEVSANVQTRGQDIAATTHRRGQDIDADTARNRPGALGLQIDSSGQNVINMQKGTTTPITGPDGQPIANKETQKRQQGATRVLALLDNAEKIVPQGTNSYLGAGVDEVARAGGMSLPGATAIAKLKTIEGALLSEMPRMEGPQSNYDVQNYKNAAANLGDPTIPNKQKMAAIQSIRDIQNKYLPASATKAKPSEASARVLTMAQIDAAAKAGGKTRQQAIAAAKAKGYTVR
jgi:hypothetical protein